MRAGMTSYAAAPLLKVGSYGTLSHTYAANGNLTSSGVVDAGYLLFYPFPVTTPMTFDRLGVNITTGGDAGSAVHLGLYSMSKLDETNPGFTLVEDGGSVAGDSTGTKSVTVSADVAPGWHAYCVLVTGVTTNAPQGSRTEQNLYWRLAASGVGDTTARPGLLGVTTAPFTDLPASYNIDSVGGYSFGGNMPVVWLRRSA